MAFFFNIRPFVRANFENSLSFPDVIKKTYIKFIYLCMYVTSQKWEERKHNTK